MSKSQQHTTRPEGGCPFAEVPQDKPDVVEGCFSSVKEFENNADWIVKEMKDPTSFEFFRERVGADRDKLKASQALKRFIPEFDLLYGRNEQGHKKGFIAMKKVHGQEIKHLEKLSPQQRDGLEELIYACLDFYEESKKERGVGYLPDILNPASVGEELGNIMWGYLSGETSQNNTWYLVDTYPLLKVYGNTDRKFTGLKGALAHLEATRKIEFSSQLHQRLAKYGPTA